MSVPSEPPRRAQFLHGHATRIADIASTVNGRYVSSGKVSPYVTTTYPQMPTLPLPLPRAPLRCIVRVAP
jgi:hypothetical protein